VNKKIRNIKDILNEKSIFSYLIVNWYFGNICIFNQDKQSLNKKSIKKEYMHNLNISLDAFLITF